MQKPLEPSLVQFGPRVSPGERRLRAGRKSAKRAPKPGQSANTGNFPFPTLDSCGMACKKKQGTEFGAIWSKGKCRTASSSSRPKNCQKLLQGAKQGQSANTGIFPFQMLDSGEMACISPRTRVWCNSV